MPSGGGIHSITATLAEDVDGEVLGQHRRELQDPPSHRFVGDIQPSLREQIVDVAMAERETDIEPNGVPNDRRRELMAGERNSYSPS